MPFAEVRGSLQRHHPDDLAIISFNKVMKTRKDLPGFLYAELKTATQYNKVPTHLRCTVVQPLAENLVLMCLKDCCISSGGFLQSICGAHAYDWVNMPQTCPEFLETPRIANHKIGNKIGFAR